MKLVLLLLLTAMTQEPESLIAEAIEAMGGKTYLEVKTERSKGTLSTYQNNQPVPSSLNTFTNYVLLPDAERVEINNRERRYIQAGRGSTGWLYDSSAETLRDLNNEELLRFKQVQTYQIDRLLRGGWRLAKEISYIPAKEVWRGQRADGLRLIFADQSEVSIYLDLKSRLPVALKFPALREKGIQVDAENRFFRYVEIEGLKVPYIVELYENGSQTLRIAYESRSFNVEIKESLFVKPANIKAVH